MTVAAGVADLDDSALSRARTGDPVAFAELVRSYDSRLRALAYRLLGDRSRMDDALQEAYVKAYRALPRFRDDANLGTWLYRITYNACLDAIRAEARRPTVPLDTAAGGAGPGESDPIRLAAARVDLGRALATLPVDQRAAVLLVDAEGLDYATAAEILGVAPGTIASRLNRARATLRSALGETDR